MKNHLVIKKMYPHRKCLDGGRTRYFSLAMIIILVGLSGIASGQGVAQNHKTHSHEMTSQAWGYNLGQPAAGFGTIFGEIRDATTGEVLPGANVFVKGTTVGVASDIDGRYTLRRVPAGELVLVFQYLGFHSKELEMMLDTDQRLEVNIGLQSDYIEGDEIFVVAQQRGQSRALTLQRQSVNIRSVVSSEQMERFADVTVEGALQRIAGMGHGGSNIRGVGAGYANITMDGQRMGSTGLDRSVDVSTLSADMVHQLEVIKVITPDMDADALSGTINISTRRPVGGDRSMNVRIGGGWSSRFVNHMGPSSRVSFSYGESPTKNFSYGVNLSYQRSADASERVRTEWEWVNFPQIDGPSDVLTGLRNGITYDPRHRVAGGVQFTFQPTERTTYYIVTNVNYEYRAEEEHAMDFKFREFYSPFETRGFTDPGRAGDMIYLADLDVYHINQYTAAVSARHLFDGFELEYKLGWGYGRNDRDRYLPKYSTPKAFEHSISFEKGNHHPIVEVLPTSMIKQYPRRFDFFNRTDEDIELKFHKNNDFSGKVDVQIPYHRSSFKFGSSATMAFINGRSERFKLGNQRQVRLSDFDTHLGRDFRVFSRSHETYYLPFIIDLQKMREYNRALRPHFSLDLEEWAKESETSFYDAHEYIFGGYGMGTFTFGRFRLMGGARVEHTSSRYAGRAGTIDDEDNFRGAVDTLVSNSHTHFFPNVQMIYALGRMTNLRMAYSRSIGRPDLDQLSPYVLWNYSSERISQGNGKLRPMLSENIDLLFEHYFMNIGQFTVGFYFKSLKDFIYTATEVIGPDGVDGEGLHAGWIRTSLLNGEEASVYGLELSWQQNLEFLPGFLGNFGTYANYSYAVSEADIGRPGMKVRLRDQRAHVVNAGLDYTQRRFFSQVSYSWGSPAIDEYGQLDFAPTLYGDTKRVYMDRYRDAANNLSMTMRYRLTNEFRIWVDASNILNHKSISYFYDREAYPRIQRLSGRRINLGLQYTF